MNIRTIQVGDEFEVKRDGQTDRFRRDPDDPNAEFSCERIQVTHLSWSGAPSMKPYTFGAEQEWFKRRGLYADGMRTTRGKNDVPEYDAYKS